jgi:uncharacterized protein
VVVIDPRLLRTVAYAVTAIGSLLVALIAGSDWSTWLFYWNAVPFNQQDPILGHDIAFYIFSLPFYELVRTLAMVTLVPTMIAAGLLYLSAGELGVSPVMVGVGRGRRG